MESGEINIEIITSIDGSSTIRRKDLFETYHSVFGALTETNLVYMDYAFKHWCTQNNSIKANILEIGFGTGLNAIATMKHSSLSHVLYHTIEPFPLSTDIIHKLNYGKLLGMEKEFESIHSCPWEKEERISPHFTIRKQQSTAQNTDYHDDFYDIVYFDAFSPDNEPELWTESLFSKIYTSMRTGAVLTTYCCKGTVKRLLKGSGFEIEKLNGPKGKREVLRAIKP